jgi:uncharacterized protein (DUF302 family)
MLKSVLRLSFVIEVNSVKHPFFTFFIFRPVALTFILSLLTSCSYRPPELIEQKSNKSFEEVRQDAEFVITENNFRITGNLKIGDAIKQRGNKKFPLYEVILFCNLSYAEAILSLDAGFIYYCPYKLSISETDDGVVIGTTLLPENSGSYKMRKISVTINDILRKIVKFAAEDDPFLMDGLEIIEDS